MRPSRVTSSGMRRSTPSLSGEALRAPEAAAARPSAGTLQTAPVPAKSDATGEVCGALRAPPAAGHAGHTTRPARPGPPGRRSARNRRRPSPWRRPRPAVGRSRSSGRIPARAGRAGRAPRTGCRKRSRRRRPRAAPRPSGRRCRAATATGRARPGWLRPRRRSPPRPRLPVARSGVRTCRGAARSRSRSSAGRDRTAIAVSSSATAVGTNARATDMPNTAETSVP